MESDMQRTRNVNHRSKCFLEYYTLFEDFSILIWQLDQFFLNDRCLSRDKPSMQRYNVLSSQSFTKTHDSPPIPHILCINMPDKHNSSMIAIPYLFVLISSRNETDGIMNEVHSFAFGFRSSTILDWNASITCSNGFSPCIIFITFMRNVVNCISACDTQRLYLLVVVLYPDNNGSIVHSIVLTISIRVL